MITCTRRIQFAAGHRVYGHESKCNHLHGHNYVVFFEAYSDDTLDKLGRVIDFGVLKERLGGWIDRMWDHGLLLYQEDPFVGFFLPMGSEQKLYVCEFNPTAEEMACHLLDVVGPKVLAGTGVILSRVTVWETENCFATAEDHDLKEWQKGEPRG